MAAPSLTYTLTNGTTADASQVMQDLNDLLNGVSDGTKDLSCLGLAVGASLTIADNTTLGSASGDDVTFNASLASSIPVKTTASYNVGSSTLGLLSVYLGRNSQTVRVIPSASMSATWTMTLPVSAGTANYVLTTDGSGTTSWSQASLTAGVTGTLPAGNGGTGATSAFVAGALVYGASTTALASSAAGTTSMWALSGGTGAPTFSDTTTRAKTIQDSSARQLILQSNGTDATTKEASLVLRHYSLAQGYTMLIYGSSASGVSSVSIGGGTNIAKAVESIGFYTAADDTTDTGTVRGTVSNSGAWRFHSLSTTASAANAFLDSGDNNNLLRSTSSRRYKHDIASLDSASQVFALDPVTYRSLAERDDKNLRWYGLIAEDVATVDPQLVTYDAEGRPDGVQYDRIAVLMLAEMKLLRGRVAELEQR